jgi:hypothetical protein
MAPPEAVLASLVYVLVTSLSMFSGPRAIDNCIPYLLLSALFFFLKKKRWVFKRLLLYEGTAYILLKKRTYTD